MQLPQLVVLEELQEVVPQEQVQPVPVVEVEERQLLEMQPSVVVEEVDLLRAVQLEEQEDTHYTVVPVEVAEEVLLQLTQVLRVELGVVVLH